MELTVRTLAGLLQPLSASRRPIDLVYLARYTLGNRSSERESLEVFRTQSKLYFQRLRDAVSEAAWRDAAHTIKVSARGIGAWQIAATAEAAETLDGDELASRQTQIVEALGAQIDEANGYIDTLLADA